MKNQYNVYRVHDELSKNGRCTCDDCGKWKVPNKKVSIKLVKVLCEECSNKVDGE